MSEADPVAFSTPNDVLRNMALTDALAMQRTMSALREAALTEVIKKLPGMNADKMLEVLNAIQSTDALESYAKLIEKIDQVTRKH